MSRRLEELYTQEQLDVMQRVREHIEARERTEQEVLLARSAKHPETPNTMDFE